MFMKQIHIFTNSACLFYSFKVKLRLGKILILCDSKISAPKKETDGILHEINVQPYSTVAGFWDLKRTKLKRHSKKF